MPHKSERHQMKKQMNRKMSGPNSETDPFAENASRIITFGSMPSYREDKMQEMKRQKDTLRKDSQTELEAHNRIDETSQFIELSPNNLSKMSHHIAPEKGILKHMAGLSGGQGPGQEMNPKERWSDLTQSDNQESHSDNNRNSDAFSDIERLKGLNGYHEELLEALQSSSRSIDLGRPSPPSDAAKKAFLDSIPEYGGIIRLRLRSILRSITNSMFVESKGL